jgi:predicted dehydrogenase
VTLRFGIIGAGGIAQSYAEVFAAVADAEIAAVTDRDPGAAAAYAGATGATVAPTVAALVGDLACDAVIVCTPPAVHPEHALTAIRAGIPVLCEKPLAINIEAARSMLAAAASAAVPFTMATKFRFVDAVVETRRLVDAGELGELIHLENVFATRVDMTHRWNSDPAISGGGVLIDNGTHSVDIARHFLGPIREVMVVEAPRTQDLPVEDSAQLLLRAESGATATIELSWSYDSVTEDYLHLYGSEGALRIGWRRSEYRTNRDIAWRGFAGPYDKITCMSAQLRNFCQALRGEEPLAISAVDAIASVQVIDAAYRSLAVGDWTAVESVQSAVRPDEGMAS